MNKLKVTKGNNNNQSTEDKMFKLYSKAFDREFDNAAAELFNSDFIENFKPSNINKIIVYGVNMVIRSNTENMSIEDYLTLSVSILAINEHIGSLYPRELINLFPIEKAYNGAELGCKDYFYSKKYMDSLPQDKPIGAENVQDVFCEYMNTKIMLYNVRCMGIVNDLCELEGETTPIDEFLADVGITPHTLHKESNGKTYLIDNNTGKVRNSNLRVLKGGR